MIKKLLLALVFLFLFSSAAWAEEVTIKWTSKSDVLYWNIYWFPTGQQTLYRRKMIFDGAASEAVIGGLEQGKIYDAAITSSKSAIQNANGDWFNFESQPSDFITFTIPVKEKEALETIIEIIIKGNKVYSTSP